MAYVGTPIDTTNQFQSLQGKRFSGDGSTTAFTLDIAPSSVFDIEVFVENVRQDPNSAYSLSGTTLTFTGAPASGTNNIYVVHQAKAVGTINPTNDSVTASSIADDAVESEHLNNNIISGQTALGAAPADTDEFLVSDAGTIKRVDYSYIKGGTNGPAFHAYLGSNQTLSNNTFTSLNMNEQDFDTGSDYDTSNYRFTPGETGKYVLYGKVSDSGGIDANDESLDVYIVKRDNSASSNVTLISQTTGDGAAGTNVGSVVMTVVDHTDVNDYYTLAAYSQGSNSTAVGALSGTHFGGYKLIL